MDQITFQYIQAGITILLGLVGVLLPQKFNPFQFKNYGVGKVLDDHLPNKITRNIPKIIGTLLIFVGIFIAALTPILGEMPW